MQNSGLIEQLVCCPITKKKLQWLDGAQVAELNAKIQQKVIRQYDGQIFEGQGEGFLKADGVGLYFPIRDGIICLLPQAALIEDFQLPASAEQALDTKQSVQAFYDEFGWQAQDGIFQDASDSEDLRSVSRPYITQCHQRLQQHLPASGTYLLDIASGPVQYAAYEQYSNDFQYRICADISIRALRAARAKLGDKGIYLLCDITNLPIQSNQIDGVVSLHTLYHVPANEQATAYHELYRVLKPKGKMVVVYSWGRWSLLMNALMLPFKLFKKRSQSTGPSLYFHAHTYGWFCREIKAKFPTKLYAWRSVNVPFLKTYIHDKWAGRCILNLFYQLENRFPRLMGRIGAYPLFVSEKP